MQENFENWNKNTKKQNSGVNSKHEFFTQQNKPKRDYDKEPIVIKNYIYGEYGIYSAFIAVPIYIFSIISFGKLTPDAFSNIFIILILFALFIYRNSQANKEKKQFQFRSNEVMYISKEKNVKIEISNIDKIYKSNDIRCEFSQKSSSFEKYFEIFFITIWILFCILVEGVSMALAVIFSFIFAFICVKFLMHLHKGGIKSLMFFDQIVIYEKLKNGGEMLNVLVMTADEMAQIREYFLIKKGIDINKIPTTWSVFSKI